MLTSFIIRVILFEYKSNSIQIRDMARAWAKQVTIQQKLSAIHLHTRGFNCSFIARQLKLCRVTISKLVNSWKRGKLVTKKERKKGSCKVTAQQIYNILKYFLKNPFHTYRQCITNLKLTVCQSTIANILKGDGIRNRVACPKPFLSLQNQIKRLKFALTYQNWTTEWLQVHFLDEKTVQTYGNGKVLVKRKKNERYDQDKLAVTETQNSKNKVNLVGVISYEGPNVIYSVSTNLNGEEFEQLVKTRIKDVISDATLLMDNATIHNMGKKHLLECGVRVLDYPPKSPDMNVIENVWGRLQKILNFKLKNINLSTKEQLLTLIEQSWKEIPANFIRNCILSMPQRLKEVIRNKGQQTRY